MLIKLDNGDYINTDKIICIAGGDKKDLLVIGLVPKRILFWKDPRLITMPMTDNDKEKIIKSMGVDNDAEK